jgi:Domain of unknown function (DUF222)
VIIKAVEDLPDHIDPDLLEQAERHLVAEAAHFDAHGLRSLGKGLLHVIGPEAADAHTAQLLEAEERAASMKVRLTLREDDDGILRGTFALPTRPGPMFKKQLMAISAPKHRAAVDGGLGERRPGPERLGQALCEWIERYPTDHLPNAGGVNATIVVTIPLVLGGKSEALDVGRRKRFHTKPCGSRSPTATSTAPLRAATGHPASATSTTTTPGHPAAAPPPSTADSSAPNTTPEPTTPTTA